MSLKLVLESLDEYGIILDIQTIIQNYLACYSYLGVFSTNNEIKCKRCFSLESLHDWLENLDFDDNSNSNSNSNSFDKSDDSNSDEFSDCDIDNDTIWKEVLVYPLNKSNEFYCHFNDDGEKEIWSFNFIVPDYLNAFTWLRQLPLLVNSNSKKRRKNLIVPWFWIRDSLPRDFDNRKQSCLTQKNCPECKKQDCFGACLSMRLDLDNTFLWEREDVLSSDFERDHDENPSSDENSDLDQD